MERRDYLPGYTGHVSQKKNVIGCTEGEIGRQLSNKSFKYTNWTADQEAAGPLQRGKTNYSTMPPQCEDTMRKTLGNRSKEAPTWIGGHTQDLKPQHIPGYSGHVPGIASENLFAKTFGETTSKAINRDI